MSGFGFTETTLPGMWAYVRSGPSIYVPNVDGLLIEYPTDVPPVNHKGVLLEAAMTNLLLRSNDMSDDRAVWDGAGMTTGDRLLNQIGATGVANTATWIRDNSNSVAAYVEQEVEYSPAHYGDADITYPHTFSVYVKKTSGATVCPGVYFAFPADDLVSAWAINTNTGVATRVSSLGTDGSCLVESYGDWWRVIITIGYLNQPDTLTARVRLYPGISSTTTPGTISVAITGATAIFDFAQLESNSPIATSAILTYDSTTTRGAATLVHGDLNDYALPEITALVEYSDAVYQPWDLTGGGSILSSLLNIDNAGSPAYSVLQMGVRSNVGGTGNCYAFARNSGSTSDASRFFDFASSGKIAASYSQERNESNTAANGVGKTIAGDSSTYVPTRVTLAASIRAYIRRAEIYMHAKSASDLATLTAA